MDDIREMERRLMSQQHQTEEKIHTIEVLNAQVKLLKDKHSSVESENFRLRQLDMEIEQKNREIDSLMNQLENLRATLEEVKMVKMHQKDENIMALESEIARLKAETLEQQRQLGLRQSERKNMNDLNKTIEALNMQLGSVTDSELTHKQKITGLLDEKHRLEEQLHTFRTRCITLESENKILVSKGVSEGDSKRWISLLEAKTQECQELRVEIQRYIAIMGEKDSIIRDLQHNIEVLKKDLELNSSSIHLRNSKLGRASRGASPVLTDRGKGTSGVKIEIEASSHKYNNSARGTDTSHYERTIQDLRLDFSFSPAYPLGTS